MILPFSVIERAVGELVFAFAVMFVIFPLAAIDCAIGVLVDSVAGHFVLLPAAFVGLGSEICVGVSGDF